MSHPVRRPLAVLAVAVFLILLGLARPASAHGFTSTVYVHVTEGGNGGGGTDADADADADSDGAGDDRLRTELKLEYDLLVVSAADAGHDDPLFRAGTEAFDAGDADAQAAALDAHHATVLDYVTRRFTVTAGERACRPEQAGEFGMGREEGVPYALLTLDWTCAEAGTSHVTVDHEIRSGLFPDTEEYVKGTKTIATYDVGGRSGSAALDAAHPSFSLGQSWTERFWEFFRLGAEHLLTGVDHILFLLALIAGSRRPREIVLAATSFTLAHSVTFLLAALGLVDVPGSIVEPVIALSIAVVAGWHLWRIRQRGVHVTDLAVVPDGGHFALDRAGWTRLAVVFCFGLVHGLGFAGALGIDAAWSWTLLWSLLVFNVGVEAVQLAVIAVVFPLLLLLRRRSRRAGLWATGTIAAGVAVMGLVWFVQRALGL
ncbi:HupE/UreJ family protein [Streptomyces sp. NPDC017991]|uniref:HupE/UreJ family protein n=1 Tax=Streptomyces sp. NPDC017991 TaxID=3365026 RepID=UPI0037AF3791